MADREEIERIISEKQERDQTRASRERSLPALLRHGRMATAAVLVLAVVLIGVIAGGRGRTAGAPPKGPLAPAARLLGSGATLHGALVLCGGPAPGRCRVSTFGYCSPRCFEARYVAVDSAGGALIAKLPLLKGRFSTTIAPGSYELKLAATSNTGASRVLKTAVTTIKRGQNRYVRFVIPVP